jgi:hypothetical protein
MGKNTCSLSILIHNYAVSVSCCNNCLIKFKDSRDLTSEEGMKKRKEGRHASIPGSASRLPPLRILHSNFKEGLCFLAIKKCFSFLLIILYNRSRCFFHHRDYTHDASRRLPYIFLNDHSDRIILNNHFIKIIQMFRQKVIIIIQEKHIYNPEEALMASRNALSLFSCKTYFIFYP